MIRPRPLLAASIVLAATSARAVTLADPAHFAVKRTWTAASLGVPAPLGGVLFAPGGATLYVVGNADTTSSRIYALPVTRHPTTHEVTAFDAPTQSWAGSSPNLDSGLDAGLELGPSGTLFCAYFGVDLNSSALGERPGGPGGSETQFSMTNLAGLTFSPFRMDADVSWGRLQISTGLLANLYEVDLTPGAPGTYTPGAAVSFAKVVREGVAGIQYVPAGAYAGNVVYASFDYGELRLVTIDPATGLAIDQGTGNPTLGTTNPIDVLFASGLGVGPLGLEFDPGTNDDLFVSTYDGMPADSLLQIGGFGQSFGSTTTTSTSTTSSTATTTSSTSTTTETSTSTDTTESSTTSIAPSTTTTFTLPTLLTLTTVSSTSTSTTSSTSTTTTSSSTSTTSTTVTTSSSSTSTLGSSTSSTTSSSTSSTVAAPATTTTTTMPPPTCGGVVSLESIHCRLRSLRTTVDEGSDLGVFGPRLRRALDRVEARMDEADREVGTRPAAARRALGRAARTFEAFRAQLVTRSARRHLPAARRSAIYNSAASILADVLAFREAILR